MLELKERKEKNPSIDFVISSFSCRRQRTAALYCRAACTPQRNSRPRAEPRFCSHRSGCEKDAHLSDAQAADSPTHLGTKPCPQDELHSNHREIRTWSQGHSTHARSSSSMDGLQSSTTPPSALGTPGRRRNGRLQACEPCRKRKVSCDHATPVCRRCRARNNADGCVYLLPQHAAPPSSRKPAPRPGRSAAGDATR